MVASCKFKKLLLFLCLQFGLGKAIMEKGIYRTRANRARVFYYFKPPFWVIYYTGAR